MKRLVYQLHKWLAVITAVFTLMWFVSGIVMVLPGKIWPKDGMPVTPSSDTPSYKDVRVSIPQAIAAAEAAAGQPIEVTGVTTKRMLGRIVYQISTVRQGRHMVDANTAERFEISPEIATQLAAAAARGNPKLGEAKLAKAAKGRPAYRVPAEDGRQFFVEVESAEVRTVSPAGRVRGMIAGWHSFSFFEPLLGGRGSLVTLILMSVVGTAMTFFGIWILWFQLQQWWRTRQTARAR